jgi:hypothetical protein
MVASKRGLVQSFASTLGTVTGSGAGTSNVASGGATPIGAVQTGGQVGQPTGVGQIVVPQNQQGFGIGPV